MYHLLVVGSQVGVQDKFPASIVESVVSPTLYTRTRIVGQHSSSSTCGCISRGRGPVDVGLNDCLQCKNEYHVVPIEVLSR